MGVPLNLKPTGPSGPVCDPVDTSENVQTHPRITLSFVAHKQRNSVAGVLIMYSSVVMSQVRRQNLSWLLLAKDG
jgi:hypothetical protein